MHHCLWRKRPILHGQRELIAYRDDLVLAAFRKAANTFQSLCPYSAAVDSGSIEAALYRQQEKGFPSGEKSQAYSFPVQLQQDKDQHGKHLERDCQRKSQPSPSAKLRRFETVTQGHHSV